MKKLLYITPMAFAMILSSCGSKEAGDDKKEEKKDRTACDCMGILLDEMKKTDDPMQIQAVQDDLDKKYPECKELVEGMKEEYGSPEKAAEACPAVGELMELMNAKMDAATEEMSEEAEMAPEESTEGE